MIELYPGRSAITCELLAAWKRRNAAYRRYCCEGHPIHLGSREANRAALVSLRRVWHSLRESNRGL